ncbi:hypothetical protein CEXT_369821 [Caerostris extrusa]|uniref:Uncharacterized protein n=1 Tax=Caerostris extrusa TaxID=172846 RepID=A0AAV4UPA6_CAEEX|nr:hypothetical protein CEXT_369821 [Caerostris extrusa]
MNLTNDSFIREEPFCVSHCCRVDGEETHVGAETNRVRHSASSVRRLPPVAQKVSLSNSGGTLLPTSPAVADTSVCHSRHVRS